MALKSKIAIVTGGSGALGSVIAERFLREDMSVAISYINQREWDQLPKLLRKKALPLKGDVTKEHEVTTLFDTVVDNYKGVDIVVNTVGGFLSRKPLVDITTEEWERMMNINLRSTFLCTREALRRMKGKNYGRVINISAMVGLNPSPGRSAYAISKAGVSMLTEIVAQEVKGTGITVNAIAPSIIDTAANRLSMTNEDFRKWVKPEEIADTICYLCSEPGGAITGTTIKAYGGV